MWGRRGGGGGGEVEGEGAKGEGGMMHIRQRLVLCK